MKHSEIFPRVKWACRRGMLELDFILTEFLEQGFDDLSTLEQKNFLTFLDNDDPDLYSWLMGFRQAESAADIAMLDIINAAIRRS